MIIARLTWHEVLMAANVAVMRQVQNLKDGRKDRYGCDPEDGWTPHIEGACGELAVAKVTNRFWSGAVGSLQADDVGDLQVRTRSRHTYDLPIHHADPDDRKFILVTGRAPLFHIHGWILGRDGKDQSFWKDPGTGRPAFFVPKAKLTPIEGLLEMESLEKAS